MSGARSLDRPEYVSDLVVHLLHRLGVEYVTLNPGATTRGMHESMVTYGGNVAPEVITCSHEEVAVAMAQGYYLATGRPQATLIHDIVGLQHASKAIYEAWLDQVPMIIIGGTGPVDASHRRPWIDWIHTAQVQAQLVRDYVKWDDQPHGAQSVAESILRAYQIAMTEPRGPVYLCLDVELQESRLPQDFALPDVDRYRLPASPGGNEAAITEVASALRDARWPVLLVEGLGRTPGGPEAVQSLCELVGVPVLELGSTFNLSNRHPLNVTGATVEVLKDADLVMTVGVKDIEAALKRPLQEGILPAGLPTVRAGHGRRYESLIAPGTRLVRIGLHEYGVKGWTSSYGGLMPADVAILGNGAQVLREVTRRCETAIDDALRKRIDERTTRARDIHAGIETRTQKDVKERWWDQTPTSTARLAAEIWEAIRGEDWVLVHGSLSGWERPLVGDHRRCAVHRRRRRHRDGHGRGDGRRARVPGDGQGLRQHPERRGSALHAGIALDGRASRHPDARGHVQQPVLLPGRRSPDRHHEHPAALADERRGRRRSQPSRHRLRDPGEELPALR